MKIPGNALLMSDYRVGAKPERTVYQNLEFGFDSARLTASDQLELDEVIVNLDPYRHTTQALAAFVDEDWLELGALNLHGRVHTVNGKHRLDDYLLDTVKNAAVQVKVAGEAADLTIFPTLFFTMLLSYG